MNSQLYPIYLMVILFSLSLPTISQSKRTTDGPSRQMKIDDAKAFKARQFIVAKTGNEEFDEIVHQIVSEYWDLHDDIQFLNYDQLAILLSKNAEKYGVLTVNPIEFIWGNVTTHNKYLRFSIWFGDKMDKRRGLYYESLLNNDWSGAKSIYTDDNIKDFVLSKTDVLFAISRIQNHINARIEGKLRPHDYIEIRENSGKLKNKTLLIAEADLDKRLKRERISKYYPYPYKIVKREEIEEKFLARDINYAFVHIVPSLLANNKNVIIVIDCANGQSLSYGKHYTGLLKFSNLVFRGHLRSIARKANKGKPRHNNH